MNPNIEILNFFLVYSNEKMTVNSFVGILQTLKLKNHRDMQVTFVSKDGDAMKLTLITGVQDYYALTVDKSIATTIAMDALSVAKSQDLYYSAEKDLHEAINELVMLKLKGIDSELIIKNLAFDVSQKEFIGYAVKKSEFSAVRTSGQQTM